MTDTWRTATCPRCQRHSETSRLEVEQTTEGTAYNARHVHPVGDSSHAWTVRWQEGAKVAA